MKDKSKNPVGFPKSPRKRNILDRRLERRRNGPEIELLDASTESDNWDIK